MDIISCITQNGSINISIPSELIQALTTHPDLNPDSRKIVVVEPAMLAEHVSVRIDQLIKNEIAAITANAIHLRAGVIYAPEAPIYLQITDDGINPDADHNEVQMITFALEYIANNRNRVPAQQLDMPVSALILSPIGTCLHLEHDTPFNDVERRAVLESWERKLIGRLKNLVHMH